MAGSSDRARRPGPISFSAETKVTSRRGPAADNPGGIGAAAGPYLATPRRSKDMRFRTRPLAMGTVAVLVVLLGIALLQPVIAVVGVLALLGAWLAYRTNRTEERLRSEFKDGELK